ncbi:MAG: RusA family crossover junction endodeoxyribonuclease [Promethearchaeota archaeon]
MKILEFIVRMKPIGKKRARRNKAGHWYNPQAKEMDIFKKEVSLKLPEGFEIIEKGIPVLVHMDFFFEPVKSQKTKAFMNLIKNENHSYIKKPDFDNLGKFVADSLSGIIYYDDNQICGSNIRKYYTSNDPRVEIEVRWNE